MVAVSSSSQNDLAYVKKQVAALNPMDVKELKVPLQEALAATQTNHLDEVFVSYQGKNYVAYGKGMAMDELVITERRNLLGVIPMGKAYYSVNQIGTLPVVAKQDEANSFGEGYRHAKQWERSNVSTSSAICMGAGAVAGIALGIAAGSSFEGKIVAAVFGGLLTSGIGRVAGVQTYGIIQGSKISKVEPDLASLKAITH